MFWEKCYNCNGLVKGVKIINTKDLRIPVKRYRPEIEGLRTIATLLVAIYHIWFGRVSGGIDVFFVLSGFLITTSLLARVEKEGKINVFDFLLGLAKRLFPQALLVISFIMIAGLFFLPPHMWQNLTPHMLASVFYYENWRLAFDAVDYLATDSDTSPFQHYWSLGIQGQFYLIWPVVILFSYFIARKVFKKPVRKTFLSVLLIIFVTSLSYSVYKTTVNQPWAYFDTFARAWEFSIGGILALLLPYLKWSNILNVILGWVGLAIICLTGVLLPVSTVFPGYLALVPITGVLLIIITTNHNPTYGVQHLLTYKPLMYLGGLTYGIYLWHWPLLLFYQHYKNTTFLTLTEGVTLLVVTLILSLFSTKVIEARIRPLSIQNQRIKVISVLAASLVLTAFIGFIAYNKIDAVQAQSLIAMGNTEDYPGAMAKLYGITPSEVESYLPSEIDIVQDFPSFYQYKECLGKDGVDVKKCSFGQKENPKYVVAMVGGSHSVHWFSALEILAEQLEFRIDSYNHDGCRFTDQDKEKQLTETCLEWNENVIAALQEDPPDMVFTTATLNKRADIPQGYINQWTKLQDVTTIFAIRDNPRMKENIAQCLAKTTNPLDCAIPRDEGVSPTIPWETTPNIPNNVFFADLTDYFCDEEICPPVIGNVVIYRDNNHITATYAKTLAPALKAPLESALKQTKGR